jgi:hypothetical protein
MRYKYLFIAIAFLSMLDLYVTYNIVGHNYELEANPIIQHILITNGYSVLALLKLCSLTLVACLLILLDKRSDIVYVSMLLCMGVYIGVITPGILLLI